MWRVWEEDRGVHRALVGKPEGKTPLGRARRRWEDIKMELQEVAGGRGDWMELANSKLFCKQIQRAKKFVSASVDKEI
jgi:hypothetical protein